MKKKLFTLFLALVASMSTAFAQDAVEIDGIYYNFYIDQYFVPPMSFNYNYTATVTYRGSSYSSYDNEYSGSVVIPSSVTYNGTTYSVTSIRESAFWNCTSLTSVTIPNSVTSIGGYAFRGCSSLTSVTIGNSVTSIGENAFYGCSSLTSVTIPNSVTSIGDGAFFRCSSLTSVHTTDLAAWCKISFVEHDSNPLCYAHNLYLNGELVKDLVIPNSVTSIGDYAFYNCSSLTSVTIGNSVTSIGYEAFAYCSSLTSVTIGNSVTSIGEWAFTGCSSLTSINVNANNPNYCSIDGVLFSKDKTTLIQYPIGNTRSEYIIPNSVTSIGNGAFYECSSLTSVTIPNSVTSIGNVAFADCSSLTSVTIGNSVTSIGNGAFAGCKSLTSVTIPNSVTSIGENAFHYCKSLTSVTIGNSVTSIGIGAFDGIGIYTNAANWKNGALYINNCLIDVKEDFMGDFTINAGTRLIAGAAFYNCSSLTSVTIPNSMTSIGDYAFYNCSSLTSVTIPNSVTSIGENAFRDCSSLTSVTIPNSVTSIGNVAFYYCSSLTSITIPESVTSIGKSAFKGCSKLTSVTINSDAIVNKAYTSSSNLSNIFGSQVTKYIIGDNVKGIGDYTFSECSSLTSVTIGNSVTSIENSAFEGCNNITSVIWNAKNCNSYNFGSQVTSFTFGNEVEVIPDSLCKGMERLTSVTFPNSVKTIGTSAFEGCVRLRKISLGTGLEEIAANAFAGCTRLYDIYVYATYPPFAEESSFANYNAYVFVPCEYKRVYILDIVWGKFKFIECISSEGIEDVSSSSPQGGDRGRLILRDGQVLILRNGKTYTMQGQEVK